mmetsp:Transcript_41500/g.91186  ORF Transcript_41500/g.91186 Transcript_41500/m.91186 type:complete len:639 (-) Transcript_41500:270-2186(-)
MEVTSDNFLETAAKIEALLSTSDFVAIDAEMTGIEMDKSTNPHVADSVSERYLKMRRVTQEFSLMQVGLCLFNAEESGQLIARPYTFYIGPSQQGDSNIVMRADTVRFHCDNGMDFNKWLKKGVPYMHAAAFEELTAQIQNTAAVSSVQSVPLEPLVSPPALAEKRNKVEAKSDVDKAFVQQAMADLAKWLLGEMSDADRPDALPDALPLPFEMPECNSFLRRILYGELEDLPAYPELLVESSDGSVPYKKKLLVYRFTAAQREQYNAQKLQKKLEAANKEAGFLRIFSALSKSQKPLIGHNCLFDLLFFMRHFHAPLPPTLLEFKQSLHAVLPRVWDTKLLAIRSEKYTESALGPLHAACAVAEGAPQVACAPGFKDYVAGGQSHDAGYDAYMTGVVFASLRAQGYAPAALENHCNLMRSFYMVRLSSASDPLSTDGTLLIVSQFEKSTKTDDLLTFARLALTGAAPNDTCGVSIRWIDDTSAILVYRSGVCTEEAAVGALSFAAPRQPLFAKATVSGFERWHEAQVAGAAVRNGPACDAGAATGAPATDAALTASSLAPAPAPAAALATAQLPAPSPAPEEDAAVAVQATVETSLVAKKKRKATAAELAGSLSTAEKKDATSEPPQNLRRSVRRKK